MSYQYPELDNFDKGIDSLLEQIGSIRDEIYDIGKEEEAQKQELYKGYQFLIGMFIRILKLYTTALLDQIGKTREETFDLGNQAEIYLKHRTLVTFCIKMLNFFKEFPNKVLLDPTWVPAEIAAITQKTRSSIVEFAIYLCDELAPNIRKFVKDPEATFRAYYSLGSQIFETLFTLFEEYKTYQYREYYLRLYPDG